MIMANLPQTLPGNPATPNKQQLAAALLRFDG
jgi:hypothetical protein